MLDRAPKRLAKKAKRGFRGYPVATVALYGPDDLTATKIAVGIIAPEGSEASDVRRWVSDGSDIRRNAGVADEILRLIETAGVVSVTIVDRIIGCPHEEGIDYEGPTCPAYPFWAGRDRWTGQRVS